MISKLFFIFSFSFLTTCSFQSVPTFQAVVLVPDSSNVVLLSTGQDLIDDLNSVGIANTLLIQGNSEIPSSEIVYVIGEQTTLLSSSLLSGSVRKSLVQHTPNKRGGQQLVSTVNNTPYIVFSGGDTQGTQYMVYDYAKETLGVDPLHYWTGIAPQAIAAEQLHNTTSLVTPAPMIPYMVYFENDVDELLNLKSPLLEYDWDSFTAMIDALVRLRYNGIEVFDMLGRSEFYLREEYKAIRDDYQLDVAYLEKMLNYIHEKGMLIQVDMMQGRQLRTMSETASQCWTEHKQEWIDGWRYYLTETPVKLIDIFALRPRNQVWDWEYKSSCQEDKAQVFNEVYAEFNRIVDEFKPGAPRVCICYHDGMEIFNEDFTPPKDFIIAWSDDGFGTFKYLPKDTKGFKFGTYMHAGFWKNHDVMDPNPETVESVMNQMYTDYDATHYMEVNGQTFRPFLLNIEAYARSATVGKAFDANAFYQEWTSRYFGAEASNNVIHALEKLHQAQFDHLGYVEFLWHIKNMQAYLADKPVTRPGRPDFTATREDVLGYIADNSLRLSYLSQAKAFALQAQEKTLNPVFFNDHVALPIQLLDDLLQYKAALIQLVELKNTILDGNHVEQQQIEHWLAQGAERLRVLHANRIKGDQNPKWDTWYHPSKRRPNNGFPTLADFDDISSTMLNKQDAR